MYLYLPQVDGAAHELGAAHATTLAAARQMDAMLGALASALPDNARLIMTADHGHLDAPTSKTHAIGASDEIVRLFNGAPTGDFRAMFANVRDENMQALRRLIRDRFRENFLVLTTEEIVEAGLFGPGGVSDETRYRIGNALVLSTGDAALDYRAALGNDAHKIVSHHGGLTPAEVRIPLVVA